VEQEHLAEQVAVSWREQLIKRHGRPSLLQQIAERLHGDRKRSDGILHVHGSMLSTHVI
jgi:hypothetical protein